MPAFATTSDGGIVTQSAQEGTQPATFPDSSDDHQPVRSDGLSTFIEKSADHGIYYRASIMLEGAANVSGGIKHGSTVSPYLTFGADVDLKKLVGWEGAFFHAIVIAEHSSGVSQNYIGGGVDVQENYAPFNVFRFINLTLEQWFSIGAKNDLSVVVGRMGMSSYFAKNVYTCDFLNHTFCGPMYGFTQSTGTAMAPLASWGAVGRLNTSQHTYTQVGAFAVDADTLDPSTRIFDLGVSGIHGMNYLGEVGYEDDPNDPMRGHYRLGVSYLASSRNDVYLNTAHMPYVEYGGQKLKHRDEVASYITVDKVVYSDRTSPERNVALFGSYYRNFADTEAIKDTWKFGVVKTGTFPGRDHDTFGVAASQVRFTPKEIDYLTAKRRAGGGKGVVASDEWIFEVGYGYQLSRGVMIRPNVQWLIRPDPRYTPTYPKQISNALVVGLQVSISLDQMGQLPHL
jgi:porin